MREGDTQLQDNVFIYKNNRNKKMYVLPKVYVFFFSMYVGRRLCILMFPTNPEDPFSYSLTHPLRLEGEGPLKKYESRHDPVTIKAKHLVRIRPKGVLIKGH